MSPMAIYKLLKAAKEIYDYKFKNNSLDIKMKIAFEEISKLKDNSHPSQEFICCKKCGCEIAKTKEK